MIMAGLYDEVRTGQRARMPADALLLHEMIVTALTTNLETQILLEFLTFYRVRNL
jgi:hypothetical protein